MQTLKWFTESEIFLVQRWFASAGDNSVEVAKLKRDLILHAEGPVGQKGHKGCGDCKRANSAIALYAVRINKRIPLLARFMKDIKECGRIERQACNFLRYDRGRLSKRE